GLAAGRVAPVETSVVAMGAVKRKSATAIVAVALFEASVFDCAMIDAVPGATPVTFPMASTQATAVFVEYHCTEPVSPTNWAAIRTVRPTGMRQKAGATLTPLPNAAVVPTANSADPFFHGVVFDCASKSAAPS